MSDDIDRPDDDEPRVFSVKKVGGKWSFDRREFIAAAGVGVVTTGAAIAPGSARAQTSNKIFAHSGLVLALQVSANRLVSGSKDKRLKLWVLPEGSLLQTAPTAGGHSDAVASVAWDPHDRFVASAGADSKIIFWKPDLTERLKTVTAPGAVNSIALSPDGRHLIAAVGSSLSQYEISGGTSIGVEHAGNFDTGVAVNAVVATGHENQFWCVCADGRILVHGAQDSQTVRTLRKHRGQLRACAFNANMNLVATGGADRTVRLWDPVSCEELSSFSAHESDIRSIAFNQDGSLIACASWDDSASVWNVNGPRQVHHLKGHTGDVNAAGFSDDSRYLYTGSDDKSIIQWDLETGKMEKRLIDLEATPKDVKGVKYEVTTDTTTTTYTLPCGSPIPAGAVCVCNCVPGSWSAPSTTTRTQTYSYHYWYPN